MDDDLSFNAWNKKKKNGCTVSFGLALVGAGVLIALGSWIFDAAAQAEPPRPEPDEARDVSAR